MPPLPPHLLAVVVYTVAAVLITAIYATKERGLIMAPPIGAVAAAAAWLLLHEAADRPRDRLLHALGCGLIAAQVAWALGYWAVLPFVGGAVLLLTLYVVVGVFGHALSNTMTRAVGVEYAVVGAVGAIVVLAAQPWRA